MTLSGLPGGIRLWPAIAAALTSIFITATLVNATGAGHDLRLMQDYLGHRDPKHTVHYTRSAGSRFEGLWR